MMAIDPLYVRPAKPEKKSIVNANSSAVLLLITIVIIIMPNMISEIHEMRRLMSRMIFMMQNV